MLLPFRFVWQCGSGRRRLDRRWMGTLLQACAFATPSQVRRNLDVQHCCPSILSFSYDVHTYWTTMQYNSIYTRRITAYLAFRRQTIDWRKKQQHYSESRDSARLALPGIFGIKTNRGAVYPADMCIVLPGQFYKMGTSSNTRRTFNADLVQQDFDSAQC